MSSITGALPLSTVEIRENNRVYYERKMICSSKISTEIMSVRIWFVR